eukprot:CAMPEP_0179002268 /NCGR_PEP_ID=MMETSP0795-20121207/11896_1 /TAXON_ID=88552 /ORGANISM="Amoebophrya sp., Strain Ameob2" /LENGTH=774 /DNA_ID=CAMNT_0020695883 /DNA_START=30 /DNA_END=2354 /DNA_ORIENTATION=+
MVRSTFSQEMKMFETLLSALHDLSCRNPIHVDAFLVGLWNPGERQDLFQWLKQILEASEIPLSVFFKSTQLFDRFLEHSVLNSGLLDNGGAASSLLRQVTAKKGICPSPMSASISTVASSPKTPDSMLPGQSTAAPSPTDSTAAIPNQLHILEQLHRDILIQIKRPTVLQQQNMRGAEPSSASTSTSGSASSTNTNGNNGGNGSNSVTPGSCAGSKNPLYRPEASWTLKMTHRAIGLACCSLVMKLDFRKHYSKHYDTLIQHASRYLFPELGGGDQAASGGLAATSTSSCAAGVGDQLSESEPSPQYYLSLVNPKAFIQSLEWPVIKELRYRLSVPCIIDFLDYFDTQCQIRSKKSFAVDVILYHPELLYGNKMTAIGLAIWFLSHKSQEHVHAILQKMQTFDSFASSRRLEEKRRLILSGNEGSQSPGTAAISEHAISTADLRTLVSQLRDQFRQVHQGSCSSGAPGAPPGACGASGGATSGASCSAGVAAAGAEVAAETGTMRRNSTSNGSQMSCSASSSSTTMSAGEMKMMTTSNYLQGSCVGTSTSSSSGGPASAAYNVGMVVDHQHLLPACDQHSLVHSSSCSTACSSQSHSQSTMDLPGAGPQGQHLVQGGGGPQGGSGHQMLHGSISKSSCGSTSSSNSCGSSSREVVVPPGAVEHQHHQYQQLGMAQAQAHQHQMMHQAAQQAQHHQHWSQHQSQHHGAWPLTVEQHRQMANEQHRQMANLDVDMSQHPPRKHQRQGTNQMMWAPGQHQATLGGGYHYQHHAPTMR